MIDNGKPADTEETRHLLVRAQAGDSHALDELFASHRAALHRAIARRLGKSLCGHIDPSDVVQEAQLEVVARMAEYAARRPMPIRSWLVRTAIQQLSRLRRRAHAARRDVGRERSLTEEHGSSHGRFPMIVASGLTPSQHAAAHDRTQRLHSVLERLSAADQSILRMRTFEGLSYDDAGARLAIEPAAARKRYGRALLRLRALLLADGLTESHL
jgi:RNA polymerase sigma-70 factor (ECF subfamily)